MGDDMNLYGREDNSIDAHRCPADSGMQRPISKLLTNLTVIALCLAVVLPTSVLGAGVAAEGIFQEAIQKETGERDLEAAVSLYKEAIARAGVQRRLAAKARMRMGSCYERLGKAEEAAKAYLEVVKDSAESSTELIQAAQLSLQRLEAQEKAKRDSIQSTDPSNMDVVREFQETRARFSIGAAELVSQARPKTGFTGEFQYRLSSSSRPFRAAVELGLMIPPDTKVESRTHAVSGSTSDSAALSIKYLIKLGLSTELPHGKQRIVVPELGGGLALTKSNLAYVSSASTGELSKTIASPYAKIGVHFLPDHVVSYVIDGNYISLPFPLSVDIANPAHKQSFGFPSSLWMIGAQVQLKIGWTKLVLRSRS